MKTSTIVGAVAALIVAGGAWYWLEKGVAPAGPTLANPASVACEKQGGTLEIRDEAGGQVGYCHTADGRVCEEWALFRDSTCTAPVTADYKNATYVIEGQPVALVDGRAEATAAPGAASQVVTQYFGNAATGDLNGDGAPDVAFILTQTTGGSGTFYYVVAALQGADGYTGTNAVLLGDRIAPQTTEIRNGQVIVNYADRAAGEPVTAQPSLGVSKYLQVQGTSLVVARPVVGAGERCGGNMLNAPLCSTGYHCAPEAGSHLPFGDVGGMCVAD